MDVEFLRYRFEDSHEGVITKSKFSLGVRHIQVVYMFLCSLVMGMLRGSNTIAVIAVADSTRTNETYIVTHDWDRKIQGSVLSSFFFGYAAMLVPAELYLTQVGDKLVLAAVLLINGALSTAMPTIINKGGWIAACNAQLFIGMTQACVTSINQNLISNWLLPNERRLFSFAIHSAVQLGTIVSLPISGMLSQASLGWELIYYSQAMLVFSMATMWVLLTSSTPDKHEAVGDTEREMIKESLMIYRKKSLNIPWRCIIHTKSFWALACSHSAANVLFIFFLTEVPALLHSFNSSLLLSSRQAMLPLVALWLSCAVTSPATEYAHRFLRLTYVIDIRYFRRIINGFGCGGVVVGLTLLSHLMFTSYQLALLVMTLAFVGFQYSGFLDNHADLTENFAGSLVVMTSAVASVVGAAVPCACGSILGGDMTESRSWRVILGTLVGFYVACNIMYTAFTSSERADWDGSQKAKVGYNNDGTSMEQDGVAIKKSGRPIKI